jgi:hypothetical protein
MAESKFDIQFAGELVPGADPRQVRERLCGLFKLTPEALGRLFSGQVVVIKRDLDAGTAARYRDAFPSGAVLRLVPSSANGLTLAPPGANLEDIAPAVAQREIDTSYLSLVVGWDWTLEDCAPHPVPMPIPNVEYLTLVPVGPILERRSSTIDE